MGYVVYNKETTVVTGKVYKTHAAAQAALTRMKKASRKLPSDPTNPVYVYGIAQAAYFYANIEKQVLRKNLLSGEEFYEAANTPSYCSPASESYWSM